VRLKSFCFSFKKFIIYCFKYFLQKICL